MRFTDERILQPVRLHGNSLLVLCSLENSGRGITHLEGDILATFPRDEVRACLLRRTAKLSASPRLTFEAGSEPGRAWELTVYADNKIIFKDVIGSTSFERAWRTLDLDLAEFAGRETTLRLYQRVFVPNRTAGNALWKNLVLR